MSHSKFHSALIVNCAQSNDTLVVREFVWPIQRALPIPSKSVHLSKLNEKMAREFDVIIFSGCQLKDHAYVKRVSSLKWIKEIDKPVLGVCAGQHILAAVHGAKLSKLKTPAVGVHKVRQIKKHTILDKFEKTFGVYSLHANQISLPREFVCIASSKFAKNEIIVHQSKPLVGVSFHPEVLNKNFFTAFLHWASTK